jgi:hypothetical protein
VTVSDARAAQARLTNQEVGEMASAAFEGCSGRRGASAPPASAPRRRRALLRGAGASAGIAAAYVAIVLATHWAIASLL